MILEVSLLKLKVLEGGFSNDRAVVDVCFLFS